jgi:Domain of unknown function (DUF6457)
MSEWIDELAETLEVEALTAAEAGHILRVSRDVAHRAERKDTPLAAFLLGMHVARRTAAGTSRDIALDDVIATTDALLARTPERP